MSRILVDSIRSNSASGDAITLDGSGKCAISATTINSLAFPTSDGSANQLLKTNGSGALSFVDSAAGGKILKVEHGTNSTQYATTSQYPQDAFTFTFTPTSATSTVMIHMTIPIALNIATGIQLVGNYAVCKNDNTVLVAQQYSQQHDYMNRHSSGHAPTCQDVIVFVAKDTPGSTSQQTYKIRYGQQSGYNHRVAIRDHEGPGGAGKDNSNWSIFEYE